MSFILHNVLVKDKKSSFFNQKVHLFIEKGVISQISEKPINANAHAIDCEGKEIYPSFFDGRVHSGEPGNEQRETFATLEKAALHGGFTDILIYPDTKPTIQSKEVLKAVLEGSSVVNFHALAAITKDFDGVNLTEMIDLNQNGALGFTDVKPMDNSKTLELALQYTKVFGGVVINLPLDKGMRSYKVVNEGVTATKLGLPGIPNEAESIMIKRDLEILRYTGGRLHFSLITTEKGVLLIEKAKKEGLNVTCDTAAHYLYFDDSVLVDFDPNHKLFPPLRNEKDVKAIKNGVKKGIIDFVVSDHSPQNLEVKDLEFDIAEFGVSSIEFSYSVINSLGLDIYQALVSEGRKVFGLPIPLIEVGEKAKFTLVNPEVVVEFKEKDMKSKSKNSPYLNQKLNGKVEAVFVGSKHFSF